VVITVQCSVRLNEVRLSTNLDFRTFSRAHGDFAGAPLLCKTGAHAHQSLEAGARSGTHTRIYRLECGPGKGGRLLFLRPARTSMNVVLPAPLAPMRAVKTPGWKAPVMPFSSSSSLGPPGFACTTQIMSGDI